MIKDNGFLRIELQDYGKEEDHLKNGDSSEDLEEIEDILKLQAQDKSLRDIARILGISLGKVQRRLKKAKDENITLDDFKIDTVSPVSDVSDAIQTIHPIHIDQQRLPYKDEADEL